MCTNLAVILMHWKFHIDRTLRSEVNQECVCVCIFTGYLPTVHCRLKQFCFLFLLLLFINCLSLQLAGGRSLKTTLNYVLRSQRQDQVFPSARKIAGKCQNDFRPLFKAGHHKLLKLPVCHSHSCLFHCIVFEFSAMLKLYFSFMFFFLSFFFFFAI